jgi:Uma2 family endonuclease
MLHPLPDASPTPRIDDRENVGAACEPVRVITVADYAELAEPPGCRYELREGVVVRSPAPSPRHQLARSELCGQLKSCVPPELLAIAGLEVDLCRPGPGTVRRPDIVVIDDAACRRVTRERTFLRAGEVRLAVEICSPETRHTDRVEKRAEYAMAGIGHYWLVDLDEPISLAPMHLADDLGYVEDGEVTGVCGVDGPFPARLRLDELTR